MQIRLAEVADAQNLFKLNEKFNGAGVVDIETLTKRLAEGRDEIVVVAEKEGCVVGFVCAQIFKSICYVENYAEITEVFVDEKHRRNGFATAMIDYIEDICKREYGVKSIKLLTARTNLKAKRLYKSFGYRKDGAVLYVKEITNCH